LRNLDKCDLYEHHIQKGKFVKAKLTSFDFQTAVDLKILSFLSGVSAAVVEEETFAVAGVDFVDLSTVKLVT